MTLGRAEALFGVLVGLAYVGLGQGLGEEYPVSPLRMFSHATPSAGRVVVRASDGLHAVSDFRDFACGGPVDFTRVDAPACARLGIHPETDRNASDWVNAHTGRGSEPVSIVRQAFVVETPRGPVVTRECEL